MSSHDKPRAPTRLFAALGPGNIVAAQRKQLSGVRVISETSIIFSGQLFEYCRERGIKALFVSHNPAADTLETPLVTLVNLPRRWDGASGWRFHLSQIARAIQLARMARRFRADLAVIDSGSAHYFALAAFSLMGVPVAVNFNNVRWPQGFEPRGRVARLIRALDSWFFRRICIGAMGCSPECGVQARSDGAARLPYFGWCGQFKADGFAPGKPDPVRNPFRLLFVGRVERNKGVFDLITIASLLKQLCKVPVTFEICGDGGAFTELRAAVKASGEADQILLRGRLKRPELLEAYGRAHALIVPTRGDFCEGMPLVCAEAVLSGLPVITSRLSNALPVIGAAIAEATPEDAASYARAVCRLAEGDDAYRQLQSACAEVCRQFLDRGRSFPAAIDRLIEAYCTSWKRLERYDPLFDQLS